MKYKVNVHYRQTKPKRGSSEKTEGALVRLQRPEPPCTAGADRTGSSTGKQAAAPHKLSTAPAAADRAPPAGRVSRQRERVLAEATARL